MAFVFWIPIHLPRLHAFYCSSTSPESLKANRTHELLLTKRTCVSPNSWNLEPQVHLSRMTNFSLRLWKHETCFRDIRPLLMELEVQNIVALKKNSTPWPHVVGDTAHPPGNTVEFLLLLSDAKKKHPVRNILCPSGPHNLPAPSPPKPSKKHQSIQQEISIT